MNNEPRSRLQRFGTGLDRLVGLFSPQRGMRRAAARRIMELSGQFKAASSSRLRSHWVGSALDPETPTSTDLKTLRTRSRDANRNDPVASGATETLKVNIVGSGLQPQAKLRAKVLGVTESRAEAMRLSIERVWDAWCAQADAAGVLDFAEIQFLALAKIVEDGEVLLVPTWVDEPWRPLSRAVELVEADRLDTPGRLQGSVQQGIRFGERGEPLSYYIQNLDKNRMLTRVTGEFTEVAARDERGRPRILHVFQAKRPSQIRGVPLFTPVLTYFKDLAEYFEAELVAARVAACLAVFITKNDAMMSAIGRGSDTETDTSARIETVEPGLVSYLGVGEDIKVVDPKRPGDAFAPFVEQTLRMIGVALGLPYELLMKDFSKTNYSSARAALLEGRRMFGNWRSWFGRKVCQPLWDLVIEEAWLRGQVDLPRFYELRDEYTRCQWFGGGWGWVDPVKEVEASRKAIDYGLSTLAEEAAGQGRDWEEVLEQIAREDARAAELGVEIVRSGSIAPPKGEDEAPTDEKDEKLTRALTALGQSFAAAANRPIEVHHTVNNQVPEQKAPQIQIDNHMPAQPAPVVNANIEVKPSPAQPIHIDNHMPAQPAPVVNANIEVKPSPAQPGRRQVKFTRDANGDLQAAEVTEA